MTDGWQQADAYERYMGRWSRQLAPRLLRWLAVPPGQRWLDVGCGTGALSAAVVASCAPASLWGADPSEGFLAAARAALPAEVHFVRATAERLPLADAQVDVVVSALVLNFLPDPAAALREWTRVTAPGGCIAACVWDYAERMELVRLYWDAAASASLLAPGEDQGERFPICRPEALAQVFVDEGLQAVDTGAIELEMTFDGFDDLWLPFLGGQGSAPAHAMRLTPDELERVRQALRERLDARAHDRDGHDERLRLKARAWTVRGHVPAQAKPSP